MNENNNFSKFDASSFSQSFSTTNHLAQEMNKSLNESLNIAHQSHINRIREMKSLEETAENSKQALKALNETASNTEKTNIQLSNIIENQNEYIKLLKTQLEFTQKKLENDEKQLEILKAIFYSENDGIAIEKEIKNIIEKEIDENHPLWDYVKDKGGDLAVAGIVAGVPIIYQAFKTYLISNGINFLP